MENVLDQTAITYPYVTLTQMKGSQIKQILEDVCDNLFNADPYTSKAATWCASAVWSGRATRPRPRETASATWS